MHPDSDVDYGALLSRLLDCQADQVLQFLEALDVEIVDVLSVELIYQLDDADWLVPVEADLGVFVFDWLLVNEGRADEDVPHLLYESQIVNVRAEELLSNNIVGVERLAVIVDVAGQALVIWVGDPLGLSEVVGDLIKVLLLPTVVLVVLHGRQLQARSLHDPLSLPVVRLFVLLLHELVRLVLRKLVNCEDEVSLDIPQQYAGRLKAKILRKLLLHILDQIILIALRAYPCRQLDGFEHLLLHVLFVLQRHQLI